MNFLWETPTRIYFGTNIYEEALAKEKSILKGNVLLVTTGKTLTKNGTVEHIKSVLLKNGSQNVVVYSGAGTNPEIKEAEEAGQLAREHKVSTVIGLGGGSAIDLAKAAAVSSVSDVHLKEYIIKNIPAPTCALPVIAIPTTAGSGSELSKGAILSDKEIMLKGGLRGKGIAPKIAIVDSALTYSMPKKLTMETGFDALTHAIESFLSKKANGISEMISLNAIRIIGENLPLLAKNLDNHSAREKMSYAAMIAGMNLYNVGNCLPHRLQYPIGAITNTSHAAGLAAIYPAWIKYEYEVCAEKLNKIFETLDLGSVKNAEDAKDKMQKFLMLIEVNTTLTKLGLKSSDTSKLAEMVTGDLSSDLLCKKRDILKKIYDESI